MTDKLHEKFSNADSEETRELLLKNLKKLSVQELVEVLRNMEFSNILDLISSINDEKKINKLFEAVVELIKLLEDSKKIEAFKIFCSHFDSFQIVSIIDTMAEINKVKALEITASKISNDELISVIKNMEETDKIEALYLYKTRLNNHYKIEILKSMEENKQIEVLELYFNLIGFDGVIKVINSMTEVNKSKIFTLCKNNLERLEIYQEKLKNSNLEDFVKTLEYSDKLEILNLAHNPMLSYYIVDSKELKNKNSLLIFKEKLQSLNVEELLGTLEDINKLEVLRLYKYLLDSNTLYHIIETLEDTNKIEAIKLCKNTLSRNDVTKIIRTMSTGKQLNVVKLYLEEMFNDLNSYNIGKFIGELEGTTQLEALKIYKDKFNYVELANLIISSENQLEALKLLQQELGHTGIAMVINSINKSNRLEALKICKDKLSTPDELMGLDALISIINNIDDEIKIKIFDEWNIDIKLFGRVLYSFKEYNDDVKIHLKQCLNAFGCENPDIELALKIVEKLKISIYKEKDTKLLSEKSKSILGEETIYSLFKYFIFNGETINIEEVLEKPELFSKYQKFRKTFLEEKQIPIMEIRDAIVEFDSNRVLLEDCMKSELSFEEKILLKGIINEGNKEISQQVNSKSELSKFPEIRKEKIDELIETDSQEALIYLLTGMSKEDYYDKLRCYIGNEQIDSILEDFGEKEIDFVNIKAVNEMINYVSQMTVENRRKTLRIWNEDLSKEFENADSSVVAKVRNAFHDADIKIRKLYGKELSNSLTKEELPKAIQDENDEKVSIIKLDDKDKKFNLLIHGLNLGGVRAQRFEKIEGGKAYICTSLISENHLERAYAKIYYGFRNISSNSLVLEGPRDLESVAADNSFTVNTMCNAKFEVTKRLLAESGNEYNEVILWRQYIDDNGETKDITPDYVVCFDNITDSDREEAKRLNIPIVFIDSKVYERNEVGRDEAENVVDNIWNLECGKTQRKMIELLKEAVKKSSALGERKIMNTLIKNMKRELVDTKGVSR